MTLFAVVFSLVMVSLIAAITLVTPALVRSTTPLGVAVPRDRAEDPIVVQALRRYRILIGCAWLVSVVLALVLATAVPVAALLAPTIIVLVLSVVAYGACRAPIQRAKRAEGWYEGKPVRLTGGVTAPAAVPVPYGWFVAALAVAAVTVALGIIAYPALPDPVPIHWNAAGEVDGYADKSVWSVFGTVMIMVALVIGFFLLALAVRWLPMRGRAGESDELNARRADGTRRLTAALLGQLALAVVLLNGWISVMSWWLPDAGVAGLVGVVVFLAILIAVLAAFAVRLRAATRTRVDDATSTADAPDDDRYWKGGLIYLNPEDPAVFVPKRFGVGWTINLASPGGIGIGIVLVLIVLGAITLAVVAPNAR